MSSISHDYHASRLGGIACMGEGRGQALRAADRAESPAHGNARGAYDARAASFRWAGVPPVSTASSSADERTTTTSPIWGKTVSTHRG